MNLTFAIQPLSPPQYRPTFTPAQAQAVKQAFKFENVETYTEDEAVEKGVFGHPVMMPLSIDKTDWTDYQTEGQPLFTVPEMNFAVCMVDIDRAKNIEKTAVEGRDGTVKEFGSFGDWIIGIKILLLTDDGTYPEEQVKNLIRLEQAKARVGITSHLLIWLGVDYVVVEKVKLIPMEGVENAQAIELSCLSDREVTLIKS